MEAFGWRGRRGSKHHMIMRAPDGVTTTAVSPKVISPKNEHHVAADFRRWVRQLEEWADQITRPDPAAVPRPIAFPEADATSVLVALTSIRKRPVAQPLAEIEAEVEPAPLRADVTPEPEPVDTAPEPVVAVLRNAQQQLCGLCGKPFATLQALSVHRVRVHSKVACEVCDSPMAPGNLPRHLRKHVADIGTHEQAMREVLQLRTLTARLRDESAEWQSMAEACEAEYAELTSGMRALLEG
jgi:hypothetical protein